MQEIVVGRLRKDVEKHGKRGCILLGKQYVRMGQTTSLSNEIYLDVTNSHVIFICGKRGGGKCLHGDTLVPLEDGSLVKVKDLKEGSKKVVSLNKDLKIETSIKTEFYERYVDRMLLVKLRSGKELILTPEHPLLTVKGWTPAENLSIGSRIATPRKMDFFGNEYIEEDRIKILAYLISEGHLSNNFVLFSNLDTKIIDDFSNSVAEFDSTLSIKQHSKPGCLRIVSNRKRTTDNAKRDSKGRFSKGSRFEKSSLKTFLEENHLYGNLSDGKFIPPQIFKATKSNISLFLNRMFSCDGTIYKDSNTGRWRISYCSKSKELVRQIQHLLLRFEINGIIRKKNIHLEGKQFSAYELELRGENIYTFLNEIGFYGYKEKVAKKAIQEVAIIKRNPNLDTIPKEIWEIYRPKNWAETGRILNYTTPKALRSSVNYSVSRQKLMTIAKADENELMLKLASSDIYWDEIVHLEEKIGKEKVYDICVPKNHNFVANDVIVHNSYTMGVIAEGMADLEPEIRQNLSFIMLDTMGIYWTMKYPNHQEVDLLREWGLKGKPVDVTIYTPEGYYHLYKKQGIPTDKPFSMKASELNGDDWCMTFGISPIEPIGILISKVVGELKEKGKDYDLEIMMEAIMKDPDADKITKDAVINLLNSTKQWGLFSKTGTPLKELAVGGQITVLDVSCYATMPNGWEVKSLVVGLISQKLFLERMRARKGEEFSQITYAEHYFSEEVQVKQEFPLVWLIIDEAHEFLPAKGENVATKPLVTIMREGRQPGISLILATQQPGKIHTDVMTQSDTVLSHRITARLDTEALGMLTQSYMKEGLVEAIDHLPRVKGAGVLFDDANERLYPFRVRPRFTWHGGAAPTALREKKDIFGD